MGHIRLVSPYLFVQGTVIWIVCVAPYLVCNENSVDC